MFHSVTLIDPAQLRVHFDSIIHPKYVILFSTIRILYLTYRILFYLFITSGLFVFTYYLLINVAAIVLTYYYNPVRYIDKLLKLIIQPLDITD